MWYLIISIPDLCTLTYFDVTPLCNDEVDATVSYSVFTAMKHTCPTNLPDVSVGSANIMYGVDCEKTGGLSLSS